MESTRTTSKIATTNVKHLSRFAEAKNWIDI